MGMVTRLLEETEPHEPLEVITSVAE